MSEWFKSLFSSSTLVKDTMEGLNSLFTSDDEREKAKIILEKQFQDFQLKTLEAANAEMDSARNREVKINESANSTWLAKNTASIIALSVILLAFIMFYIVVFTVIPTEKKDVIIYMLGGLISIVTMIIGYYFGSSKGSSDKDAQIQKILGAK